MALTQQRPGQGKTLFKKGDLNIGQVLLEQVLETMKELRQCNYEGFINGVEGFYLILLPYAIFDKDFQDQDQKIFEMVNTAIDQTSKDIHLWPEDKQVMLTDAGLQAAKLRLGNLILLANRRRLWFEQRRFWDERNKGETESGDLTDEELQRLLNDSSPEEEQNADPDHEDEASGSTDEMDN